MFGKDLGAIAVIYTALFIFGFFYNKLVEWLERQGYDEGFTAILVVFGTLVTLGGVAAIDWQAALAALGAFCASGFWMVVGSWWRYVRARRAGQEAQRRLQ